MPRVAFSADTPLLESLVALENVLTETIAAAKKNTPGLATFISLENNLYDLLNVAPQSEVFLAKLTHLGRLKKGAEKINNVALAQALERVIQTGHDLRAATPPAPPTTCPVRTPRPKININNTLRCMAISRKIYKSSETLQPVIILYNKLAAVISENIRNSNHAIISLQKVLTLLAYVDEENFTEITAKINPMLETIHKFSESKDAKNQPNIYEGLVDLLKKIEQYLNSCEKSLHAQELPKAQIAEVPMQGSSTPQAN
ncbi:MAG: hypothetical protein ACHP9Y_00290 [Gammaproteobacteria bacterium]